MNKSIILECKNICKQYTIKKFTKNILNNICIKINYGEMIAIIGKSGSGKSTLLHILGSLDEPSSGEIIINNISLQDMNNRQKSYLRNKYLGFIYQFHHLLPDFTILENVAMPLLINKYKKKQAEHKSKIILEKLSLDKLIYFYPSEISGGEKQRVSVARALINKPKIILADEPTGNLDRNNAEIIYNLFSQYNKIYGTTFIVVTHDNILSNKLNKIMEIKNGKIFLVK